MKVVLVRLLWIFSPTIIVVIGSVLGIIGDPLENYGGLATGVAIIQGWILLPFLLKTVRSFEDDSGKYALPLKAISLVDLLLVAVCIFLVVMGYQHNFGR